MLSDRPVKIDVRALFDDQIERVLTNATSDFTFESSDPTIASFNSRGFIEPIGAGNASLTIRYQGLEDTIDVQVIGDPARLDAAGASSGSVVLAYVSQSDRLTLFALDPITGQWTESQPDLEDGGTPIQATTFHDPKSERSHVALIASDGVVLLSPDSPTGVIANLTQQLVDVGATAIVRAPTSFVTQDQLVFLAGFDPNDELVMYWQTGSVDAAGEQIWSFTNLDRAHLQPQGLQRPRLADQIVSYVTPWNGLNIAGLDDRGNIWGVWWAPGLPQWRLTNVSDVTGAPPLFGGLTAYVTPWGGINLVGLDADGHVSAMWWVPGFDGEWRLNDLSGELNHPGLLADSVTSYVTPWGGTNIAGLDTNGDLVVYWWAPGLDRWVVSPLSGLVPDAVLPLTSIEGLASPNGLISLFGLTDGQQPIRYYWQPGGEWQVEYLR